MNSGFCNYVIVRTVVPALALSLLAALLMVGSADAATKKGRPFSQKSGVVYACYKVKGKNRGTVRVVKRPRACKRLRGWRRMSWSATGHSGPAGATGVAGTAGQQGIAGPQGSEGAAGPAGVVEKSLVETVELQTVQIQELTSQVSTLTGQLTTLEATVGSVCTQLTAVTDGFDGLVGAVAGISLIGGIGVLEIPLLPELLGTFEC